MAARHLQEARQVEDVAVHREDAVRDGEAAAVFAAKTELAVEVRKVAVPVDEDIRAREAAAVDDGGVVQLVGENGVPLPDERGDRPHVRHVARAVDERGLRSLEARERRLQRDVGRLRAGREARTARARAPGARRRGGGLRDARVAREVEVVVRGEDDEVPPVHRRRRTRRRGERAARARKPRRLPRGERGSEAVEAAFCPGRGEDGHIRHEDGRLFQEADRLRDAGARPPVEEDASAVRVALLLDHRDAPVAERARRHVARHVVRVVRDADLPHDAGGVLDLRREDDRLGVVVLAAGGPLFERRRVVHVRRAHAACRVGLQAFQRVRVEKHRPAQGMALGEARENVVHARDPRFREEARRDGAPLRRRPGGVRRHRERRQPPDGARLRLDLQVHEVGHALRGRERARDEDGCDLRDGRRGHDLLRAGDVRPAARRAHLDGVECRRLTHGNPPRRAADRAARRRDRGARRRCGPPSPRPRRAAASRR